MIPSSQEGDKTDIYVNNLKTGELEVGLTLSDVHISHYHNSEYHNKSLYIIRRIGYDGYPDNEWTDELWRYDTRDKSETKLYSAQGLDFRLAPDEKYVALQHDQKLVFVDALGNLAQEFTLDQLGCCNDASYPLTPHLTLQKWSDEGNEFWGATNSGPAPQTFYRIELAFWQATVYDISELTVPCEYDLNPNTGKLVYSDYPQIYDVDGVKEFEQSRQIVTLFVYDLNDQSVQTIATLMAKPFHPKWLDDSTVEYNSPEGEGRTTSIVSSLGWLAYVRKGDIWVKALPDGASQRLTTDGHNSEPRWSPSGKWLAFRKDVGVWLVRANGRDLHSPDERGPMSAFAWSPVNDRLAYVAGSDMLRLEAINADGTNPVTLFPPFAGDSGKLRHIAWSPGGRWIAYERWEGQAPHTRQSLWKVPADGGEPVELYASGMPEKGEAILAGWSSDGRFLFFWQGDILSASMLADGVPLYAIPAEGGSPAQLAEAVLVYPDFVAPQPAGGQQVALVAGGGRGAWTNKTLHVVLPPSGKGEALDEILTAPDQVACSPSWSPDGQHIAFAAMPDKGDLVGGEDARQGLMSRHIWVAHSQGAEQPRQLTDDPTYRDERPLWSADGSHLLSIRMDGESQISLWLIPFREGTPRLVADDLGPLPGPAADWFGYYGHAEWDSLFDWWRRPATDLPPGLVYRTTKGLWRVDPDGRPVLLTDRPEAILSPDALNGSGGGQALFTDDSDVWLIDLATGEQRNLTATTDRYECCPQWWPVRPDVILFGSWPESSEITSQGFLTAMHVDGSEYRVLDEESSSYGMPAPSPDGQVIAYGGGKTARLYRWGAGSEIFDPAAYGLAVQRIGSAAWSPDGKRLAWVVGGDLTGRWRLGVGVFDLAAQTSLLLHPYEPRGVGGWPQAPAWSPDGQWLAYYPWPVADPAQEGVWVLGTDGKKELFLGSGNGPIWSPDGQWLAFNRTLENGETAPWIAKAGTWNLRSLDLPPNAYVVDWIDPGRAACTSLAASRAALSTYQPVVTDTRPVVEVLLADIACALERGAGPADLAAALDAVLAEETEPLTIASQDLTGDGQEDVLVHLPIMGLPALVFLSQDGPPYPSFKGRALPPDFAETISRGWPHSLNLENEGIEQPALQLTDLTGDGVPEILLSYTFAGGSNFRLRPQAFQWREGDFCLIFAAELVSWAGYSTLALEPDPTGDGQVQIALSYPYLYNEGFDHKMVNHPQGRQVWRWDAGRGRFVLSQEHVDLERSSWDANAPVSTGDRLQWLTNEGEQTFRAGAYKKALGWYNEVLRLADAEGWQAKDVSPDWRAYATFRRAETLLLLGQPDDAPPPGYAVDGRTALQAVVTGMQGDLLGDLAQTFLEGYSDGSSAGATARGIAAMQQVDLYSHFYYERAGALRFPMDARGVLYPGAGLAAYLNTHPDLEDDPAGLRAGLLEAGFSIEDVTVTEGGDIRIALRLPNAPNADGALAYWRLKRDETGWRVLIPEPWEEWPTVGWFAN